jgi:ParB/RepB/Spo0J family partition protein
MSIDQPQAIDISKPSFGDIPLDCIRASTTNPRKIFDDGHLQDLANSIKTQGVAQPILVRPIEVIDGITYFEIVAGERRFRASRLAGMPTVPAIVRELSDRQAYEIQVLENLQRVDLHPLEEAEGFEVMMTTYGDTADQLAEKIGKSRAYIYASLKLCALEPAARKFFYSGDLTKSTALLVARIPVKALQVKCAQEITQSYNGAMSTRNAASHIERNYMLSLKKVTFKPSDADLCKDAGSCTACPKRTGNQPEIFTDVNADVCTDPVCFKAKGDAHIIRIKQIATANGQTVLSGADAKKVMPSSYVDLKGGYVDLDKPNYKDEKNRTYRQILGKEIPAITLLESPHSNEILSIVKIDDIMSILESKGVKTSAPTSAEADSLRDREKAQEAKAKQEREYRRRVFMETHHASLMMNLVDLDLRLVAQQMFENLPSGTIPTKLIMSLYEWTDETFGYPDRRGKMKAAIALLTPAQLNQFIRDCALCRDLDVNVYTATDKDEPPNLLAFAARVKVDAKKILADVKAEAKAKSDAKQKSIDSKKAKLAKTLAKTEPAYVQPAPALAPSKKPAKGKTKPAVGAAAKSKPAVVKSAAPEPEETDGLPADHDATSDADKVAPWPFPTNAKQFGVTA